jgi:hypothetical protein
VWAGFQNRRAPDVRVDCSLANVRPFRQELNLGLRRPMGLVRSFDWPACVRRLRMLSRLGNYGCGCHSGPSIPRNILRFIFRSLS